MDVAIATFPSPTFGPLFAFHCPLFFTKNNNLECRDVLKTVTVTSDHTLRTTKHKWSSGFMVLDVSYSRVLGQRPTFYCPLLAVSCPEVWARMYRHIYTVQSMYTVHTKKTKIIIIILQPVDGATDGATRRVICPASVCLRQPFE